MDVYKLRSEYYKHNPDGHFFDYETLKFFGESLSNMNVLKNTAIITDCMGEKHTCYILSKYSRNYPGGGRRTYAHFDVETFEYIIPGEE